MRNELFVKNFNADGPISPYTVVRSGATDTSVAQATDGAALPTGAADSLGADGAGDPIDVIMGGIATVRYGATIERDQPLRADAQGRAVPAVAGEYAVGFAALSGVLDDLGSVELQKHRVPAEPT